MRRTEIDYKKYLQVRESLEFTGVNISNQSRIKCKRCKLLLIKPFQTDCGFRCCCECIDQINNQLVDKCPFCGMELQFTSHIHMDKSIEKEILKMKVNCLSENCNESISMKDLLNHFENCMHIKNRCNTCFSLLANQNENLHVKLSLHRNGRNCQKCCSRKRTNVEMNSGTRIKCPNNCCCKTYDNIEYHLQKCPKQTIDCFFSDFGCIEKLRRENLYTHLINNHNIHRDLMIVSLIKSNIFSQPIPESSPSNVYCTPNPEISPSNVYCTPIPESGVI